MIPRESKKHKRLDWLSKQSPEQGEGGKDNLQKLHYLEENNKAVSTIWNSLVPAQKSGKSCN